MPKITVLVATYKSSMLSKTLDSIAAQTFEDYEVLVLDDAGSAECRRLVEQFGDPRFIYVGNPSNLGPALNHAAGIQKARGDLTAILNHDDFWEPNLLRQLSTEMDLHPEAVAAFTRAQVADADGTVDPSRTERAWAEWDCAAMPDGLIQDWFATDTSRLGFPIVSTSLFKTERAKSIAIPAIVGGAYDYWLSYRLSRFGPVIHVGQAIGYWREHPGNLSHHRSARKVMETVYINSVAARDRKLPRSMRIAAARALPRGLAAAAKQSIRDIRS